jgi:hypothetical protein
LFIKFKNIFSKNESIFESPICIICGYKNDSFKLDVNNIKFLENSILNLSDKYIFNKIKEFIKRILPTQEKNGYWAICLYEKIVK